MISDLSTQPIPQEFMDMYNYFINEMNFKRVYIYYNHMSNKYIVNTINPYSIFRKNDTWFQLLKTYEVPEIIQKREKKIKLKNSQTKLKL